MNFIFIGYEYWNTPIRRHHHIVKNIARNGHFCVFLDPPVFIGKILKNKKVSLPRIKRVDENVILYSPISVLPFSRYRIPREINSAIFRRDLENIFKKYKVNGDKTILFIWDFWEIDNYLNKIKYDLIVFDIYDNYMEYHSDDKMKQKALDKIIFAIDCSDKVLTSSSMQYEFACKYKEEEQVFLIPNGVDVENYFKTSFVSKIFDDDKPIIVYLGGNSFSSCPKIDWDLLDVITDSDEYNFLFIGPLGDKKNIMLERIKKKKNVAFIGLVDAHNVPSLLRNCSIAMLPWRMTKFTEWIFPLKVNEYMAAGLPIVSVGIPDMINLRGKYPKDIFVAETYHNFIDLCKKAQHFNSMEDQARRKNIAKNNSWMNKVEEILATIISEF